VQISDIMGQKTAKQQRADPTGLMATAEDIKTRAEAALIVLMGISEKYMTATEIRHQSGSTSITGFYSIAEPQTIFVKVPIRASSPAGTPQDLERDQFDFSVLINYEPISSKYVNVHGPALGSADDIGRAVSAAVGLAKRFQTNKDLKAFLRTM
jgi:hypothetical protein